MSIMMSNTVVICDWVRMLWCILVCFKHKTAYQMRISDWSSDVVSSDLLAVARQGNRLLQPFGVGDKADLDEDAFEFDLVQFVPVAVLVGQTHHLRTDRKCVV